MRLPLAITIAMSASVSEIRAEHVRTSGSGHDYTLTCNSSGYILRSNASVSRFIGQGANTQVFRQTEVIYLGRSCDAFSKVLGGGTWCWANGGFVAELEGARVGFPRQELYCPTNDDLGDSCWCD